MSKWHGRNRGNKQKRGIVLYKKTQGIFLSTKNSSSIPRIIFYCKKCKHDFSSQEFLKKHQCL